MDYIINPWWFYLVQMCGTFKCMFYIFGTIIIFIGTVLFVGKYIEVVFYESDCNSDKKMFAQLKRACIIGVIVFILGALIPTEDTLIKMQIAKFGTYTNVEKVLNVIDEKTDALINAIGNSKKD